MDARELLDELGITEHALAGWIKLGLPCKGRGAKRRFEREPVRAWLLAHGFAEPNEEAPTGGSSSSAVTLADVAAHFGVSERTIGYWRRRGMPGDPGHFDLDLIESWKRGVIDQGGGNQHQAELMRIRARMELLELQKIEGQLVEASEPARVMEQAINLAVAILDQAPDRALAALPPSADGETRSDVRAAFQSVVDNVKNSIADALLGLAAEVEA